MSKADKDGWVRHRGGKCPVDESVKVQTVLRSETKRSFDAIASIAGDLSWKHHGDGGDIMAYRLHKPAEQGIYADDKDESIEPVQVTYVDSDGPLQWRDRITEIDATTQALTTERAELVQKLAIEGFALIGRVVEPGEDMSDWRNWKVGDVVEYVGKNDSSFYIAGVHYVVESISQDFYYLDDESDGHHKWTHCREFKWHSRPSA